MQFLSSNFEEALMKPLGRFELPNGTNLEPLFTVLGGQEEPFRVASRGNRVTIGYLMRDTYDGDFFEGYNDDHFNVYKSEEARSEDLKWHEERNKVVLVVQDTGLGKVQYSICESGAPSLIRGTKTPIACFIPSPELQEAYKYNKITRSELIKHANERLAEYSMHCNGDTYSVVTEQWERKTGCLPERYDCQLNSCNYGLENAQKALKNLVWRRVPEPAPNQDLELTREDYGP
ncbi:hypothetical protein ACQU0X_25980 [Pseudovibrio ascidiaceicola]|uniref:hypothetical protein n=1 Tax=Pseudovibrio ascidiaceicola TaxID=285279 RepID=UPI003D3679AF